MFKVVEAVLIANIGILFICVSAYVERKITEKS